MRLGYPTEQLPTTWEIAFGGWATVFVTVFVIGIMLSFVSQQAWKWNTRRWDWTFQGSALVVGVTTFCYFTRLFGFAMSMWGAVPLSLLLGVIWGIIALALAGA